MEVDEFHAKTWTPGEIVWVTPGSGGKNICGKLVSTFKDTIKLRMKATTDATTEWSETDFRVFHCRQIRKDESENPPPILPKMKQVKVKKKHYPERRVFCLETRKEYSIPEAISLAHVVRQTIYEAARTGCTAGGYHFAPVGWVPTSRKAPVQCIETGEVFPTTVAAAKYARVNAFVMRRACEDGRLLCGYHFKRV